MLGTSLSEVLFDEFKSMARALLLFMHIQWLHNALGTNVLHGRYSTRSSNDGRPLTQVII